VKYPLGAGVFVSVLFLIGISAWPGNSSNGKAPLQTVNSVDLNRYMGDWYEIARTPNRFQSRCVSDTSAHYELMPNGKVSIKNECRIGNGKMEIAKGKGSVEDKDSKAKLRVSFFWPFSGDYWIIVLDKDYRYAVVGEPDRKNLWVLSRTPSLDQHTYDEILKRIQAQGYEISRVQKTTQSTVVSNQPETKPSSPEIKPVTSLAAKSHAAADKLK
jgi:apolipoprotein D and lipocalin family protein